jgi:integrase
MAQMRFGKMTALTRAKNGTWQARKGLPADVRLDYQKLFGPAWEAKLTLPASLSTPEAKSRFSEWLAEIESRVEAIRAKHQGKAQGLTAKEARALAGEWYQQFIAKYENRPGTPADLQRRLDSFAEELELLDPELAERRSIDLTEWITELGQEARPLVADLAGTAQFLANAGIVLAPEARNLFLDFVAQDFIEALYLLKRRAAGDYSPDDHVRRFPAYTRPHKASIRPWALFDQWVKEAQPAASTVGRWRNVFLALDAKFQDAGNITEDDARQWIKEIAKERTAKTARGNWLAPIKRIFTWAAEQNLVAANPFSGIKVTVPKRITVREKAFTSEEAATILRAALASKEPARRWLPWLCAYSGARGGEITQLRGRDIRQVDGVWAISITPDAGHVKTNTARAVPLHLHLVEQGFLEFVKGKGDGPLFYEPERSNGKSDPLQPGRARSAVVLDDVARWVRQIGITDRGVSPNHSWRHSFKMLCERNGISERISDAITGHAPVTAGRAYGMPNLSDMSEALKKFPRYLRDE